MRHARNAIAALMLGIAAMPAWTAELIMVEEHGCPWCARWNAEIAPVYPKTPEGARAPLRRIDIRATSRSDVEFASPPVFTPTFVLVEDGREIGRIEGYPGEDFFWGMLGQLLERLPAEDGRITEDPS